MGAGMAAYILGGDINQIEYAAEIAMEHCLGMTCDPMLGYVQIPCIERNAIYAAKAMDCAYYSIMSDEGHLISLDEVVETMLQTGKDLHANYKETSKLLMILFLFGFLLVLLKNQTSCKNCTYQR